MSSDDSARVRRRTMGMTMVSYFRFALSSETAKIVSVFFFLGLEWTARTVVLAFYALFPCRRLLDSVWDSFSALSTLFSKRLQGPLSPQLSYSTAELVEKADLQLDDYFAETQDGFVLVLHRIRRRRQNEYSNENEKSPPELSGLLVHNSQYNPGAITSSSYANDQQLLSTNDTSLPILLMHGLMMSDESWVCNAGISLPIYLANLGHDVWLANNRGNKYSWKHRSLKRNTRAYWDFSIDELARYDVPTCVETLQKETGKTKIIYIGFSNGTAQMFAALAAQPRLNDCVAAFIALAPACRINNLTPKDNKGKLALLYPLLTFSPLFFFLVFGKKSILSTVDVWKRMLARGMFCRVVDIALEVLFNWRIRLSNSWDKEVFYFHLYSATSTKVARHWFQILGSGEFEHYDEGSSWWSGDPADVDIPKYQLSRITCPVLLLCGEKDYLSDNEWIVKEVHNGCMQIIQDYEHLDFLVARNAREQVHSRVEHAITHYVHYASESSRNHNHPFQLDTSDVISHPPVVRTPHFEKSSDLQQLRTKTTSDEDIIILQ